MTSGTGPVQSTGVGRRAGGQPTIMTEGRPNESELERYDRNWDELLGELRVTQTGVAILFSVLLTVPFSARFDDVTEFQRGVYLAALVLSALTTVVLIAPVASHRALFGKGHKGDIVRLGNRLARLGLLLLALTLGAVLLLVLDVLVDRGVALAVSTGFSVSTLALWFGLPRLAAR